jgi:hypothetical protein
VDSAHTMYGQVSVRTPGTYDLTNWGTVWPVRRAKVGRMTIVNMLN